MKISPLEISLGLLMVGALTNDFSYTGTGMAIYQSTYIEPIKLKKGCDFKYKYIDEGNIRK